VEKSIIDGFISRFAQAAAAALLLGLATQGFATPRILGAIIASSRRFGCSPWFSLAVDISISSELRSRADISARARSTSSSISRRPEVLVEGLSSTDVARVVAAMNLLAQKKHGKLIPALILYHASETVLIRALEIFGESDRKDWVPLGERALGHANVEVRIAALRALARHDVVSAVERATEDVSSRVQAYAALYVSMRGEETDLVDHPLIAVLLKMPGEFGVASRVGLLSAVADAPTPRAAGGAPRVVQGCASACGAERHCADGARDGGARRRPLRSRAHRPARVAGRARRGSRCIREDRRPRVRSPGRGAAIPVHPDQHPGSHPAHPRLVRDQRACDLLTEQLAAEKDGRVRYRCSAGSGCWLARGRSR